jgi:hypothetical protein
MSISRSAGFTSKLTTLICVEKPLVSEALTRRTKLIRGVIITMNTSGLDHNERTHVESARSRI